MMTPRMLSVCLLILSAGAASAQDPPAPPPEIAETVELCASCHGMDGIPTVEKAPIIWGQHEFTILTQLKDYRAERRLNEIMTPIAKDLSDEQMKALAAYFGDLPWPEHREPASEADVGKARSLEVSGQCIECHQKGYVGVSQTPRVGRQKADYTEQTLRDFRDGIRNNAPPMAAIVRGWSDEDIAIMSRYLAGL